MKLITRRVIEKNRQQAQRFIAVGAVNTALDFGILFGLQAFGVPVVIANIISTSVAFIFSFAANKRYTFQTTGTNIVREISLFIIVTLIGLWVFQSLIIIVCKDFFARLFGSEEVGLLFAKIIATAVSMTWNYVMYKTVVFRHNKSSGES